MEVTSKGFFGNSLADEYGRIIRTDRQSEETIQTLEDMLTSLRDSTCVKGRVNHLPLVEISYNNSLSAALRQHHSESDYNANWKRNRWNFKVGIRNTERRPFKVIEMVGSVAYKLELPEELIRVHNTFHVSNLKKCYTEEPLAVSLDGLHFDDKLILV
ncbi:hypothetical protein Tco_0794980 [Tanacetum coccineum]